MKKNINFLTGSFEYLFAFANAGIFLLLSLGGNVIQPDSLISTLLPNVFFFIGSLVSWVLMMGRGWALTPIGWYVLGTGLFFGFGVIAGGLHVHPWADHLYGNDLGYLVQVNTLNAASVFLVLLVAGQFIKPFIDINHKKESDFERAVKKAVPLRFFLLFCLLVIVLKLIYFPDTDSLVARSLLAKIYFLFPAVFLLGGIVVQQMGWVDRVLFYLIFLLQITNGALLCNKYEILMPIIAFMVGMFATSKSYKFIMAMLIIPVTIFWFANPVISQARLHHNYNATENSINERAVILWDILSSNYFRSTESSNHLAHAQVSKSNESSDKKIDFSYKITLLEKMRAIGVRFDVASIEGFLIREYNEGRPGNSLQDFWAVLIPRIFWPEKPVITRFGNELNSKYYNQTFSAIAPTYSGEAYWNYGWSGVFLVSIYLGIVFGIFSKVGLIAARGTDVAYLFVAYPLLISATFVESWIVATYIGGLAIIVLYYVAIKMILKLIARGVDSA